MVLLAKIHLLSALWKNKVYGLNLKCNGILPGMFSHIDGVIWVLPWQEVQSEDSSQMVSAALFAMPLEAVLRCPHKEFPLLNPSNFFIFWEIHIWPWNLLQLLLAVLEISCKITYLLSHQWHNPCLEDSCILSPTGFAGGCSTPGCSLAKPTASTEIPSPRICLLCWGKPLPRVVAFQYVGIDEAFHNL